MKIVYEYINKNNIKILDFNNIKIEDIDINNEYDIERFVLSHIYYIYENNQIVQNIKIIFYKII